VADTPVSATLVPSCGVKLVGDGGGARTWKGRAKMKLLRLEESARVRATAPMFVGEVFRQGLTDGLSDHLKVGVVSFRDGGRNTLHTHEADQLLIITEGEGTVATETEEHEVTVGDAVFIPAGERHWHGARPGKSMTHLAISVAR
jgi:quercetin dioxygenase-like cupin family protein